MKAAHGWPHFVFFVKLLLYSRGDDHTVGFFCLGVFAHLFFDFLDLYGIVFSRLFFHPLCVGKSGSDHFVPAVFARILFRTCSALTSAYPTFFLLFIGG